MNRSLLCVTRWFKTHLWSSVALGAWLVFGFFALKSASDGWETATTTITGATLLFALLCWVNGDGQSRVFWSGFAICGLGYFMLLLGWNKDENRFVDDLGTVKCLEWLFRQYNADISRPPSDLALSDRSDFDALIELIPPLIKPSQWDKIPPASLDAVTFALSFEEMTMLKSRIHCFAHIGHCLFAILFGFIGGQIALRLVARNQVSQLTDLDAA